MLSLSKLDLQLRQLQAAQIIFSLHPDTLVKIEVAAPFINKKDSTVRTDATRRPESLPRITRRKHGKKKLIFFRVSDLLEFNKKQESPAETVIEPTRPGRPTKAEQAQRQRQRAGGVK